MVARPELRATLARAPAPPAVGRRLGADGDGERPWGPIGVLSGFAERLGGAVSETIGIDAEPGAVNGDQPARAGRAAAQAPEADER